MRLEFEPNAASMPVVENGSTVDTAIPDGINFEYLLTQGIKAAQNGDRGQARTILMNAAQVNPRSEDTWMWLASISDYPEELLAFLQRALEINPENPKARSWHSATRSLLAKTLVQRAIAAHQDGSTDLADQCLNEALALDNDCEAAWIWKASLSNDEAHQLEFLERVLEINADNVEARSAVDSIKASRFDGHMQTARIAVAAGQHETAIEILDEILAYAPDKAEPWLLKSHFVVDLNQKLNCLKNVLEIEPVDAAIQSAYKFLLDVAASAEAVQQNADQGMFTASGTTDTLAHSVERDNEVVELAEPSISEDLSHSSTAQYRQAYEPEEVLQMTSEPVELDPSAEIASMQGEEILPIVTGDNSEHPQHEQLDPLYTTEMQAGSGGVAVTLNDIAGGGETHEDNITPPDPSSWPAIIDDAYATQETVPIDPYIHQDQFTDSIPAPSDLGSNGDMQNVGTACPFCSVKNDPQAFECGSCHAMLTLSDLESILANTNADREVIQEAVTQMEAEWNSRDFSENELTVLAIGSLNLRNYESGHKYLQEASRLCPNNVILSGQVNALAIRIEEMNRASDTASTTPQGRTILVVDDSATVRKLISAKLEKSGHNVICAEDGVEALARIAESVPDLVLLDITMPRMDGYEVCKNIRSNPAAQNIPVVMISGKDGFFDKVRGRMAGTTGYVTKPFGPETLMKALETYLVPGGSELS